LNSDPRDIIKSPRLEIANQVHEMDTSTLLGELERALAVTAETIAYLGAVWRELERRGIDLSRYRIGMGQYLPLIAAGQLDPQAIVRFSGRISLLRAVQTLPLPEQQRLARGEPIRVVSVAHDGSLATADVDAANLTAEQIRTVFDYGRIRSEAEQENMLASARTAVRRREKLPAARQYKIRVSQDRKVVRIGRMSIPADDLIEELRSAGLL
jgi:hypothetical protein